MDDNYLQPSQESAIRLFSRNISGPVVMMNLLRLRKVADYTANPELSPDQPITGRAAFQRYVDHSLPYLHQSGGELLFMGQGSHYFIGPPNEQWDLVMLVRQGALASFMAFASHTGYVAGPGHRTAAVVDSRLLPVVEMPRQT